MTLSTQRTDSLNLAIRAIGAQRLRSFLTLLGIAVGIAAVILLTSIGEGIHRYVLAEFTQFGTNVDRRPSGRPRPAAPLPACRAARGRCRWTMPRRWRLPNVIAVTPSVSRQRRGGGQRPRAAGLGATASARTCSRYSRARSERQFLPEEEAAAARAQVVLGPKLKNELFGAENALGARVRIGGLQFRVIGVMEPKGQFLGIDLDDTAFVPAARALELFNRAGLNEIDVAVAEACPPPAWWPTSRM
jgi:putative ABC transport system permease protein